MTQTKTTYIYGKHALEEAILYSPKAIEKVFIASYFDDEEIKEMVKNSGIPVFSLTPGKMSRDFDNSATHQGIAAIISFSNLMLSFKEFIGNMNVTPDTCLVLLGELQDPQNVGAVIRSAAAFGVSGVLIPEHNQAPVTGAVVKVSAGMAFKIPLVSVPNINTAIRDLKEKGFWIYGLEGDSKYSLDDEKFDVPTLFILGNESKGIRQKTKEICDVLLSIPTDEKCESLNAAASAAIALYAWGTKHKEVINIKNK